MCIFQASSITVPGVLTSQAWRGTFMKTPTSWCSKTNTHIVLNMQIVQICMHNVMSASGGEAAQHRDAVQGITHPDARSRQSLPLRWVDGYKTLGPLRAQLGTWGPLVYPQQFRPTWTSARCWRRPTGQGWPPCRDITSMSPVADWDFTRDQLSALLLLFCCYCEQTKFLVATVSKHYFYLQPWANYIVSLKLLFHFENISYSLGKP